LRAMRSSPVRAARAVRAATPAASRTSPTRDRDAEELIGAMQLSAATLGKVAKDNGSGSLLLPRCHRRLMTLEDHN
jgi:hypothetical protein